VEEARREEDVRTARRKRNALIAAVCAAVLIAGGVALWRVYMAHIAPQTTLAQYEPATLDLKSESFRRGTTAPATKSESRVLPRKPLDLTIYLPVGSERGQYQIRLEQKAGEPVLETEGAASVENGTTMVRARLDLHSLAPGQYFFGIRQPPWEWTYVVVKVQ
jgi:hypothetical protein